MRESIYGVSTFEKGTEGHPHLGSKDKKFVTMEDCMATGSYIMLGKTRAEAEKNVRLDGLLLFLAYPDHIQHRSGLVVSFDLHRKMVILLNDL
jgi:hypothetical protein